MVDAMGTAGEIPAATGVSVGYLAATQVVSTLQVEFTRNIRLGEVMNRAPFVRFLV